MRPGREPDFEAALELALPIIRRQPGCVSAAVSRCTEDPSTYLLLAEWESIEAHETGFRGSADYREWKTLLHDFYHPFPRVTHFIALGR